MLIWPVIPVRLWKCHLKVWRPFKSKRLGRAVACKYQNPFVGFAKQFCFAAATTAALDAMCGMQADLRAVFMDREPLLALCSCWTGRQTSCGESTCDCSSKCEWQRGQWCDGRENGRCRGDERGAARQRVTNQNGCWNWHESMFCFFSPVLCILIFICYLEVWSDSAPASVAFAKRSIEITLKITLSLFG